MMNFTENQSITELDFYHKAHLLVAAIRILEFRHRHAPTLEQIVGLLSISMEEAGLIMRRLADLEIIEMVCAGSLVRLFIRNFLKIEEIPRGTAPSHIDLELANFKNTRKEFVDKIELFQASQSEKKKSLFADLEKKLKMSIQKGESETT
ncbi:MAG: hypothetical protein AB7S77_07625 [Desulfatirhabdiaceae bacterium]